MPFKQWRKADSKHTHFVYFNQKTYEYKHFREKSTVWLAWVTKRLMPALFILEIITFAATLYNALAVDKFFLYTSPSEYTELVIGMLFFPLFVMWFKSVKQSGKPFLMWNMIITFYIIAETVYSFILYGNDMGIPIFNFRFLIMCAAVIIAVFHIVYCLKRLDFFRYTLDEMKTEVEAKRDTAYTGRFDE